MNDCALGILLTLLAQTPAPRAEARDVPDEEQPPLSSALGSLGLDIKTADGRYRMHLWFRGQFRYSYPFEDAPTSASDFEEPAASSIDVNRARIKLGGNVYQTWLKYYLEYDFVVPTLLDLHFTVSKVPWLQLRVGQWKVTYNRERVDSSGKQQFVDRSIVNREFTLDRQSGVMVGGHVFPGRRADSWYFLGVFNGNGINASNDDGSMMWMARYQWHPFGRELPFSQSDVEFHEKPAATLAFGAVKNRGPFTRFSTNGGGQLDGFEPGEAERYDLRQLVEETAFKYRGFSFQHEFHWKDVEDRVNQTTTNLRGSYVQAGYLPWARSERALQPLELAVRYAFVDPDSSRPGDSRKETTFGVNWFFARHDNKLTFDVSRLSLEQVESPPLDDSRVRLQWDISF